MGLHSSIHAAHSIASSVILPTTSHYVRGIMPEARRPVSCFRYSSIQSPRGVGEGSDDPSLRLSVVAAVPTESNPSGPALLASAAMLTGTFARARLEGCYGWKQPSGVNIIFPARFILPTHPPLSFSGQSSVCIYLPTCLLIYLPIRHTHRWSRERYI